MPRPDPALLDPARYPHVITIEPRFGDLDVNMHVNNVAMAGYIEDSRVRFHRASGYREGLVELTSMVASVTIEYLGQVHYPEPVEVRCALGRVGRTSHELLHLVLQEGRVAVFASSVMVTVGKDGPAPVPAHFAQGASIWMLDA